MFEKTDLFVKTSKIPRAAHNIARQAWIGHGRNFAEIAALGSVYRGRGIIDSTDKLEPLESAVVEHLLYDLKMGFIKWYRLMEDVPGSN